MMHLITKGDRSMKRLIISAALALLASVATGWGPARAQDVQFHLDIGNAPPPPRIYYHQQPRFVVVPGTRAYWWENRSSNYEVYRYGDAFYVLDDGYWYRANNMRGPFRVVRVDYVPQTIVTAARYRYRYGDWRNDRRGRWDDYRNGGYSRNDYRHQNNDRNHDRDWRNRNYDNNNNNNDYNNNEYWYDSNGNRHRRGS